MKRRCRNLNKTDNKGSSIIIVIIAIAFVGMLAAVILGLATMNIQMKYVDYNAKKNFYSAETVLDQINAGLQEEAADAFKTAYLKVMQTYSEHDEAGRQKLFVETYIPELRSLLKKTQADVTEYGGILTDQKYSLVRIKSYVESAFFPAAAIESADPVLNVYATGVVLKDLKVTYTDSAGYESIIVTDIRLKVPEMDFTDTARIPELFKYSLIADKALQGDNTGAITFDGNIYGGSGGISLTGASIWQFPDEAKIISREAITAGTNSLFVTTNGNTAIWAKDIIADSADIQLNGKCYLADDLVLKGYGSNVVLKGEYYGYGNSESDSSASSAIVVNGSGSFLNMNGLNTLLLAGHSFIGTKSASTGDGADDANVSILMGESLAVKGDQIAYMVPDECIGVVTATGEVIGGKNPMNAAEYQSFMEKVLADNSGIEEVSLTKKIDGFNHSMNEYTVPGQAGFQKIFVKGYNNETLVYYYMVMSKDKANSYYWDYYSYIDGGLRIKDYMSHYVAGIEINGGLAKIDVAGNMMTYDSTDKTAGIMAATGAADTKLEALENSYSDMFEGLTLKLNPNRLEVSESELGHTLFENLVRVDALKAYLRGLGIKKKIFTTSASDGQPLNAVLTDNAGMEPYDSGEISNTCLIVATGDVEVSENYSGLILAGGNIIINADSTVTAVGTSSEENLLTVFQCRLYEGSEENTILSLFSEGESSLLNGCDTAEEAASYINISELVTYENWSKQ